MCLTCRERTCVQGGESLSAGRVSQAFRPGEVARVLGISRRRLQYWAQTGLVRPTAHTQGGHRRYAFEDLVALRTAKHLIESGVSLQRIRKSLRALRRVLPGVRQPLAELVLVASENDVVALLRNERAFEAVSGQAWLFDVARFQREVEAGTRALRARAARRPAREARRAGTLERP